MSTECPDPPPAPAAKPEPNPSPNPKPLEPTAPPADTTAKEPSAGLASLLQRVGRGLEEAVPRIP